MTCSTQHPILVSPIKWAGLLGKMNNSRDVVGKIQDNDSGSPCDDRK